MLLFYLKILKANSIIKMMNNKHLSECYKYSFLPLEFIQKMKVSMKCVFGGKWKQKILYSQKHWEYSFFAAKNHALFIFASLVLSIVISI